MTDKALLEDLAALRDEMHQRRATAIGIPVNLAADYSDVMNCFGDVFLNNIGDVFIERKRSFSTHKHERLLLDFYAGLYGLSRDQWWGYVTSGSTEGNLAGLWLARERLPEAVLYHSADSHYSIGKIARLLRIQTRVIPAWSNGEMDYAEFDRLLGQDSPRQVIVNLNIGTTMKGAIDNLDRILDILAAQRVVDFHIHCDAALFGGFLPLLDNAPEVGFRQPIDSLAISGYKFIGAPFPCGLVLTRRDHSHRIRRGVEYISSLDSTLTGSRNGHAPLLLWYALKTRGEAGLRQEARDCVDRASRFQKRLVALSWPAFINEFSNIIVLKKPADPLIEKWRLISEGDWSHIVVMQHVTDALLDEFADELVQSEALL